MTNSKKVTKKKNSRSLFYRISAWLHLWLGLITGIVMVIVCVTGCIWVFQDEITSLMEPENKLTWENRPVLTPSQLKKVAEKEFPGQPVSYAMYQYGKAATIAVGERRGGSTLRVNPYTGEVMSKKTRKKGETDFFRFILNGHRFLWMPYEVGRPIVNYSTLIFVITLITGMVLWWPKKWNKSSRQQSFTIKWGASAKRVNYDLHNVFGFYALLVLMAIGLTGMVYGIQWWSKSLYWVTTGGKQLAEFRRVQSDSTKAVLGTNPDLAMDMAWNKVLEKHPDAKGFYYGYPDTSKAKSAISITIYPSAGKFYDNRGYSFDRYTLEQLDTKSPNSKSFAEAGTGDKIRRMNYDIHVGAILGLPGKILAFFGSLIGATLPITGFIIWWGKGKKKKPKDKVKVSKAVPASV